MPDNLTYPSIFLPRLRYRYCPMCRAELTRAVVNDDNIVRVVCPACGWVHYPANAVGVVVIIRHDDGLVAILPPGAPPDAPAALPAGHVEYNESPEDAACREAYEETGLRVVVDRCLGWYFRSDAAYPGPNITFMFETHAVGGSLRGSEEGRAEVFPLDQFPPIAPDHTGSQRAFAAFLSTRIDPDR